MTMSFRVSDPKLLQGLAPGMKVRFAFVQQPGGYRITGIE
jgi:Cu/Ag efflux protein CusF